MNQPVQTPVAQQPSKPNDISYWKQYAEAYEDRKRGYGGYTKSELESFRERDKIQSERLQREIEGLKSKLSIPYMTPAPKSSVLDDAYERGKAESSLETARKYRALHTALFPPIGRAESIRSIYDPMGLRLRLGVNASP